MERAAAERRVVGARCLHEGQCECAPDRDDAEEPAGFEQGMHAGDRAAAPVGVVADRDRRVVVVRPRADQPGGPGVAAVRADYQTPAAVARRSGEAGDSLALAPQAVHGHPDLHLGARLRGPGQQDRVEHWTRASAATRKSCGSRRSRAIESE